MSELEELKEKIVKLQRENNELKTANYNLILRLKNLISFFRSKYTYEPDDKYYRITEFPRFSCLHQTDKKSPVGSMRKVYIELSEYQRVNLLWLLRDLIGCGNNNGGVEPFTYANTGDWAGEITNMIDMRHIDENVPKTTFVQKPNSTRELMESYIRHFLKKSNNG